MNHFGFGSGSSKSHLSKMWWVMVQSAYWFNIWRLCWTIKLIGVWSPFSVFQFHVSELHFFINPLLHTYPSFVSQILWSAYFSGRGCAIPQSCLPLAAGFTSHKTQPNNAPHVSTFRFCQDSGVTQPRAHSLSNSLVHRTIHPSEGLERGGRTLLNIST